MNLKGSTVRHYIILITFLSLLSACGGGSSNDASKDSKNFTYQPLPTSMSVNEGEPVTLTLSIAGEGANQVKFNWQIEDDIAFSGQGTDSISFTAPEVERLKSIRVQVKLDDSNSRIIGFSDQGTFVSINNTDPVIEPTINEPNSEFPKVEAINFNNLTDQSTWFYERTQFTSLANQDGSIYTVETRKLSLLHIEAVNVSTETITVSECGLTETYDISAINYEENVDCGGATSSLSIRQTDNEFRLERMCDDQVVTASTFTKHSDSRVESNGELNIDFTTYDDLASTSQVCGIVATSEVKSYGLDTVLTATAKASVLRLFTEYLGNPLELQFQIDAHPTDFLVSLSTNFSNQNVAKIYTDVLPEISDLSESRFGTLTFDFDNVNTNIKADFDFSMRSRSGPQETVNGEFTLLFE